MPKRKVEAEEPEPRKRRARASVPRGGVPSHQKKDPDEEPDTRPNKRIRLGKRWSQIVTEVKEGQYTWAEFVEELSPEELARGKLKDRYGKFQGRPPALVPRGFQQACIAEIHRRFNEKVQARLLDATEELISLSGSGFLEQKDRAKVLIYLIERVMGPVPKTVHVTADEPWQGLLTQGLFRPAVDGNADTPTSPPPRSDRYAKRRQKLDPEEDEDD